MAVHLLHYPTSSTVSTANSRSAHSRDEFSDEPHSGTSGSGSAIKQGGVAAVPLCPQSASSDAQGPLAPPYSPTHHKNASSACSAVLAPQELALLLGSAESSSEHPLARAMLNWCRDQCRELPLPPVSLKVRGEGSGSTGVTTAAAGSDGGGEAGEHLGLVKGGGMERVLQPWQQASQETE
eukprot:scaffold72851_cov19-Tisochrysis_lutea.AAC.7